MKHVALVSILLLGLAPPMATTAAADDSVDALRKALSESSRSDADKARDAGRKPAEVVTFLGFGKEARILDVIAAGGWYSEVLSIAVGPSGKVWAQNTDFVLKFREGANDKALSERLADGRLGNVIRWDRELDNLGINPASLDGAFTALNFHDFYNRDPQATRRMLSVIKLALKPGGVLGIIDHAGVEGNDNSALHRIPEDVVIELATRAGFELEAKSDLLRNPDDDHSLNVFAPEIRGKTDRFLLKFRKPR